MNLYQITGIISLLALCGLLLNLVLRWPLGVSKSFSQHAAQSDNLVRYYQVAFLLSLPGLAVFLVRDVFGEYDIALLAGLLFILSSLFQIACTFIPERGQNILKHRVLAGISGGLLIVAMGIVLSSAFSSSERLVIIFGLLLMIGSGSAIMFGKGRNVLLAQCAYYLSFYIPLFVISFL